MQDKQEFHLCPILMWRTNEQASRHGHLKSSSSVLLFDIRKFVRAFYNCLRDDFRQLARLYVSESVCVLNGTDSVRHLCHFTVSFSLCCLAVIKATYIHAPMYK